MVEAGLICKPAGVEPRDRGVAESSGGVKKGSERSKGWAEESRGRFGRVCCERESKYEKEVRSAGVEDRVRASSVYKESNLEVLSPTRARHASLRLPDKVFSSSLRL